MIKKLTQTYKRSKLDQIPFFYQSKKESEQEWNYLESKYSSTLTNVPFKNNPNSLEFKIIKVGEEEIINEFIQDILLENGKLHNRIDWCKKNNIDYSYEITDV